MSITDNVLREHPFQLSLGDRCAGCRDPKEANCEVHLLHTDSEYREAYALTHGRFQVFAYDEQIECRASTIAHCNNCTEATTITKALNVWLELQAAKQK